MDFGELVEPLLGSALQGSQLVPNGEEFSFLALAELLGILHLFLMVISVLGEDLDLSSMFLGELGEFGPQLSGFI